jgi:hypothetical protein
VYYENHGSGRPLALIHRLGFRVVASATDDLVLDAGHDEWAGLVSGASCERSQALMGWLRGRRVSRVDGQAGGACAALNSRCRGCCQGQPAGRWIVTPRA